MNAESPIRVTVPFDPLSYAICLQHVTRGLYTRVVLMWTAFIAALCGFYAYHGASWNWSSMAISLGFVIVFFAFMSSRRYLAWSYRRANKHLSSEDMAMKWDISAEGLGYASGISQGSFKWKQLCRVTRIPEGFLLWPQKSMVYWMPMTGFAAAEQVEAFAVMARAHCPAYHDRSRSAFAFLW